MSNLHVIATSPQTTNFVDLRAAVAAVDAVLFIEDGVYFSQADDAMLNFATQRQFFLSEDLSARGLALRAEQEQLNYDGFVDLTTKHERCISWY